jgi:hypothetical protein
MPELLDDLITLRDWLRWGVSRVNEAKLFFGHGCDNAHDEAAWLILHALHLPPDRLDPYLDARLTRHERLAVLELLQQRIAKRLPAAYLTHEAWQAGLRVYVDSDSVWFTLNASWNGGAWARDDTGFFCGGFRFSRKARGPSNASSVAWTMPIAVDACSNASQIVASSPR